MKLISDTILELSLLVFSKDSEGKALNSVRKESVIYVISGACSLLRVQFSFGLGSIFIATNVVALIYFVKKVEPEPEFVEASGIGLLSNLRLDGTDFNSRLCGIETL
ncbi:YufK family protein [Bacillus sp. R1-10]